MSGGAIGGLVIGVLAGLNVIGAIVFLLGRRRAKRISENKERKTVIRIGQMRYEKDAQDAPQEAPTSMKVGQHEMHAVSPPVGLDTGKT